MSAAVKQHTQYPDRRIEASGFQATGKTIADHFASLGRSLAAKGIRGLVMLIMDTETQAELERHIKKKTREAIQRYIDAQMRMGQMQRLALANAMRLSAITGSTIHMVEQEIGAIRDPEERRKLQSELNYLRAAQNNGNHTIERLSAPPKLKEDELEDVLEEEERWSMGLFNIQQHLARLHRVPGRLFNTAFNGFTTSSSSSAPQQRLGALSRSTRALSYAASALTSTFFGKTEGDVRDDLKKPHNDPGRASDIDDDEAEDTSHKKKKKVMVIRNGQALLVNEDDVQPSDYNPPSPELN